MGILAKWWFVPEKVSGCHDGSDGWEEGGGPGQDIWPMPLIAFQRKSLPLKLTRDNTKVPKLRVVVNKPGEWQAWFFTARLATCISRASRLPRYVYTREKRGKKKFQAK